MQTDDLIAIGKFGRPHGVRGELRYFPYNADSEILDDLDQIVVAAAPGQAQVYTLDKVRWGAKFGIISLAEVSGREAAAELTNAEVFVDPEHLPMIDDADEFYFAELEGLRVVVGDEELGEVAGLFETGANEVLVVRRPGARDLYVPFIADAVADVDLEAGVIELEPLEQWAPAEDDEA